MKKIIFLFAMAVLTTLIGSSQALAGYCLVTTESDSSKNGGSLRYKISKVYSGSGSNCTPPASDPGDDDYFNQVIIFATEAAGYTNDVNELTLGSAMTLDNENKTLVIGNWSGDIASTDDISYNADYLEALVAAGDYGNVVIDASGFKSGINPFECAEDTADVYFRNLTIKLNGVSEEDFWSDCRKNGGDMTIESNVEDGGKDGEDCIPTGEICDGVDNDCDETVDEGVTTTYYYDGDGDGYYADGALTQSACSQPEGYTTSGMSGDCDDANASVNPGQSETCGDGIDNNCDEAIDPEDYCTSGTETGYCSDGSDNDGDGLTDCDDDDCASDSACAASTTETICDDSTDNDGDGYTDCDDTDCDSDTDACPTSESDCDDLADNDGDGDIDCDDSDCSTSPSCEGTDNDGDGVTVEDGDCDDTDSTIYPGAGELCGSCTDDTDVSTCTSDAVDQDCDGLIDEGCSGSPNVDDDGDGLSENAGDCDDTDDTINPDAVEICDDGIDNDCDGTEVATDSEEYLDGTLVCDITELPGSSASTGCGCDLNARRPDSQTLSLLALAMLAVLAGMGVVRNRTVK